MTFEKVFYSSIAFFVVVIVAIPLIAELHINQSYASASKAHNRAAVQFENL